jgi:hypothetical protein
VLTTNGNDAGALVIASLSAGCVWPGLRPITSNTAVLAIVW